MAWYLCPYAIDPDEPRARYCTMNDYTHLVFIQDGGRWAETEVLGNMAVVKVAATPGTIAIIDADPRFRKLPLNNIDDRLSTLSAQQANTIHGWLLALGYADAEITNALGNNIRTGNTLADVLRFAATRRLKPRWDDASQQIVLDGPAQACKSPDAVNGEV